MIRLLTLIAVIGFIVSVICLGGAAAFGGAAIDQGWRMPANWEAHLRDHDRRSVYFRNDGGRASEASRSLTWDGSPRLELSVPGELHYTQAPGPARITISGDRRVIDNVRIERGQITRVDPLIDGRVVIEMTAPNVSAFVLSGSNELDIEGYNQEQLAINSSGSAEIRVQGQTRSLRLELNGSGEARMGDLEARNAQVDINGSAEAIVAPRDTATINVSGSGEVTLTTRPSTLRSNVSGSGRINMADEPSDRADEGAPDSPAQPSAPTQPAVPATGARPAATATPAAKAPTAPATPR